MRRALVAALLLLAACDFAEGKPVDDEALEQTARDVVAMLGAYDCERLPTYLAAGAEDLFRQQIDAVLMDSMEDPVERVCFVLGVIQEYPRSETMTVHALAQTPARAELLLTDGRTEAEMLMLFEGGSWKVDHEWALKQVQDLAVQQELRSFAITQDDLYYYGDHRFTANPDELTEATSIVMEFGQGIATTATQPMIVYAALGPEAKSVCGSALSRSGELFLIRAAGDGSASYARGPTLPAECPGRRLAPSW